MMMANEHGTGWTQDSGWQAGMRRTLPIPPEDAWDFLLSPRIVSLWLGESDKAELEKGKEFHLSDETQVKIVVLKPDSHLRLRWKPVDYQRPSTLQVRLIPSGKRTVFAFHQENLPSAQERQKRLDFFRQVFQKIDKIVAGLS
jgi:uncharacterized protein YndB with AHSA1/START domain